MPSITNLDEKREDQRPPEGEGAPKPPPRRTRQPRQAKDAAATRPTPADRKLAEAVAGVYQVVGVTIIGVGLRASDDGLAGMGAKTCELAEPISAAWVDLANKNPAVKKALVRLTEASSMGVLFGLHLTMVMPLLADRGVVPSGLADLAGATAAGSNGNGANAHN